MPDREFERRLADLHSALDRLLDVEAGLRDAQLPTLRTKLDESLDEVVETQAGLRAIVPGVAEAHAEPDGLDPGSSALVQFARLVTDLSLMGRLWLRSQLPLDLLSFVEDIARNGHRAREIDEALRQDCDIQKVAASVRRLVKGLSTVNKSLARDYGLPAVWKRLHELNGTLLTNVLVAKVMGGQEQMIAAREHSRAVLDGLESLLARVIADVRISIGAVMDRITWEQLSKAHIARVLAKLYNGLRYARDHGFVRTNVVAQVMAQVREVVTDFAGADLVDAELGGINLTGIQWTEATRWPVAWESRIRHASVEIGPGRYEIQDLQSSTTPVG